jgi:uncharacterized protein YrrD
MKKTRLTFAAILFVCAIFAGQVLAEEISGVHGATQSQETNRFSEFIGQTVKDREGTELGEINDFVFGKDGKINHIILSRGEIEGADADLVPVPWETENISIQENALILSMDKQKVEDAPSFTGQEWERFDEQEFQDEVHSYYDMENDKNNDRAAELPGEPDVLLIGITGRGTDYIGKTVKNEQGEALGEISYIILSREGADADLIPIPWEAENISVQGNNLILRMDKQKIEDAPSFTGQELERFAEQNFQDEVHGYYGTEKAKNKDNAGKLGSEHGARQTREIHRFSEFIGQPVRNQQGEELGEVNDVVFGKDGNINYIILSRGEIEGADADLVPLPWETENISVQENTLILSMDKQEVEDAPSFTVLEWERFAEQNFQDEVHGYYGTEKAKNKDNAGKLGSEHGARQTREINRFSEFIGQPVRNQQGEELGEVNDVVFGKDGNINYIILSRGEIEGADADLVPVPWETENISVQENTLILSMDKQEVEDAPSFSF